MSAIVMMCVQPLFDQIMAACGNFSSESKQCADLIVEMDLEIGSFNIYNIVCEWSFVCWTERLWQYDTCGTKDYVTRGQIMEILRQPNVTLHSTADAFQWVGFCLCSPLIAVQHTPAAAHQGRWRSQRLCLWR
jgi:hypothetical protein